MLNIMLGLDPILSLLLLLLLRIAQSLDGRQRGRVGRRPLGRRALRHGLLRAHAGQDRHVSFLMHVLVNPE